MLQEVSMPTRSLRLSDWPKNERPREKLLEYGASTLTDAELIALLFGTGIRGSNALELARTLLREHGSLRNLLSVSTDKALSSRGLGPARVASLRAALELARRHYLSALRAGVALASPSDTTRFLGAQLRDRPYEVFCCLYLDTRHRLIAFEEMFRGTLDGASVHPREVLRQALAHNAAAVILAHNHPSGVAEPSRADELITLRLRDALSLVDIRVLDHLIVAGPDTVSLAERGLL
jgi:DNA repair protein RadC